MTDNKRKINVLDHGYVTLIDYMGSDDAIANAARISYDKGTKKVSNNENLIRYLFRHRHTSPFEMVEFQFELKMPLFVIQQLIRHRTANINQMSLRYSEAIEEFYIPNLDQIKEQSKVNNQGRGEIMDKPDEIAALLEGSSLSSLTAYKYLLDENLAKELSRMVLPANLYSKLVWKMDLHNLFHFLKLRIDKHAQWEIQEYAKAIYSLIQPIVPIACKAFEDYSVNATTFSHAEMMLVRKLVNMSSLPADITMKEIGLSDREITEFKSKLFEGEK